jgi:hypothetical protein
MGTAGITASFRRLLGRLETFRVASFGVDSDHCLVDQGERNERPAPLTEANIVSSLLKPILPGAPASRHIVAVDIDWPAHLIPSSTPGHSHLYVEVPGGIAQDAYFDWLDASAKIGLIQKGYAEVARLRGHSDLRLPWVSKYDAEGPGTPMEKPDDLDVPLSKLSSTQQLASLVPAAPLDFVTDDDVDPF